MDGPSMAIVDVAYRLACRRNLHRSQDTSLAGQNRSWQPCAGRKCIKMYPVRAQQRQHGSPANLWKLAGVPLQRGQQPGEAKIDPASCPRDAKCAPPRCATTPAEESSDFLETRWVPAAARTTAFREAKSLLGAARGSQTVPPQVRKNARTGDQQVFGNSLGSRCSEDSSQAGPKLVHKAMFVISDITFKVTFRSVT